MTREEAIQELQNCKGLIQQDGQDYLDERDIPLIDMAIEALQDRQKGEWIKNDDFICSECGCHMIVGDGAYNFCPICGADMRGEVM